MPRLEDFSQRSEMGGVEQPDSREDRYAPHPSRSGSNSPGADETTSSLKPQRDSTRPKGAVRAKSGCYTCRIRRKVSTPPSGCLRRVRVLVAHFYLLKKCDEKPDKEGNCQTCSRLRLQCLGFGAKRPDWMRVGVSLYLRIPPDSGRITPRLT